MIRIGRDKTFGAFDKNIPPVITVRPGDVLCLETEDSHDGTIRSEADRYYTEQFRPNPATGPVAVEGAEAGDTLTLDILEIRPGPLGYTTIRPTWGLVTRRGRPLPGEDPPGRGERRGVHARDPLPDPADDRDHRHGAGRRARQQHVRRAARREHGQQRRGAWGDRVPAGQRAGGALWPGGCPRQHGRRGAVRGRIRRAGRGDASRRPAQGTRACGGPAWSGSPRSSPPVRTGTRWKRCGSRWRRW